MSGNDYIVANCNTGMPLLTNIPLNKPSETRTNLSVCPVPSPTDHIMFKTMPCALHPTIHHKIYSTVCYSIATLYTFSFNLYNRFETAKSKVRLMNKLLEPNTFPSSGVHVQHSNMFSAQKYYYMQLQMA